MKVIGWEIRRYMPIRWRCCFPPLCQPLRWLHLSNRRERLIMWIEE